MSAPMKDTAAASSGGRKVDWTSLKPLTVDHEDAMGPAEVKNVWARMMDKAGLRGADEKRQASFKLAVYTYGAINGTSRVGSYNGEMTLADGTKVSAAVIPQSTGSGAIRKFFRGNMEESYLALKESRVMEDDERAVAKAASMGISAACAFARADWFADCPYFTPAEKSAYDKSFSYSIERARRAREGGPLERVEDAHLKNKLAAQGPAHRMDSGEIVEF